MDIQAMEHNIIHHRGKVISKEYALAFVFAHRSRVKELEEQIHQLRLERLKTACAASDDDRKSQQSISS